MFCRSRPVQNEVTNTMQNIKQILPAVIMAAGLLNADNLYQDPQSRFAIPVPAGWTQSAGEGTVQLVRNEAS